MRGVLLAAAMVAMSVSAQAADMPDFLRGSQGGFTPPNAWQGFYVGGQGAWATANPTFLSTTMDQSLLAKVTAGNVISQISALSEPVPAGPTEKNSVGYGAFVGYNWQWDDVVAGLEMSYLHGNFGGSISAAQQFPNGATLSDGLVHDPLVTSTQSVSITDYATFRARAGYAFGSFLPYAFGGFAMGYGTNYSSVKVNDSAGSATVPLANLPPLSLSSASQNRLISGYSGGLGIDVKLVGGLFVRAEWEYVRFTQQVDTNINSLRAGLGYKF
jgi:outer membrane immunogenic protein